MSGRRWVGRWIRAGLAASVLAAVPFYGTFAQASTLDAGGHLVFDGNAKLTLGFESFTDAQGQGAAWLTWNGADTALTATGVTSADWASGVATPGVVVLPNALEGTHALKLVTGVTVGLALVDQSLFNTLQSQRVAVSFWGLSMGAEPELDIVYPGSIQEIGPNGFGHLVAVRTGRETSDGWAEYSTGPIDGVLYGNDPLGAIILTARYATDDGTYALDSFDLAPPDPETILDASGYALIDGVEIVPVTGSPMPFVSCTQATAATTCGPLGECAFGHCVDGSVIWGAVPSAADYRADMVNRWAFIAEHLGADRKMAGNAPDIFSTTAISAVTSATAAPGFYGGLNTLVNSLQDGHTALGVAPSDGTEFFEAVDSFNAYSGTFDLCFGLANDDLPGGSGGPVYSVFWISSTSAVGTAFGTSGATLIPGDMLTEVDGLAPDAWLDTVRPRFGYSAPNDPLAQPAGRALLLAGALTKYGTSAVFSSCTAAGTCTNKTIAVADIVDQLFSGSGPASATSYSRECTGRFTDSVSTWGPSNDDSDYDVPVVETVGPLTTLELDGFEPKYDDSNPGNPYAKWLTPVTEAVSSGQNLLVDARLGHGGLFSLGKYFAHQIRGTGAPYFTFAVPRGTWDDIDPTWLFDPSVAACADANAYAVDFCGWSTGNSDESTLASPPIGAVKVAWMNGNDVSMNDIVPHDILGTPNVRMFGPADTSGAYGEVSEIPPIINGWTPGRTQVLDMRFGSSFATAVAGPWASGVGVPPDQTVLENVSDILAGTDTVLTAAKAWLAQ